MSALTAEIERRLRDEAGLYIAVEEDEGRVVLTGLVDSEAERLTALGIAAEVARDLDLDDNLEVSTGLAGRVGGAEVAEVGEGIFTDAESDLEAEEESLEPGDFTDQAIIEYGDYAAGPSSAFESDEAAEGDEVFVPPTDPVGTDREVIGGLATTSMDEIEVERSADGRLGDEAIRDAILRELREDAATTDLEIDVEVIEGDVYLRGTVPMVDDAENAEEVAARVPGVSEVFEELDVEDL